MGGSSPDNAGTCQYCQRCASGERDKEEYERNQRHYVQPPRQKPTPRRRWLPPEPTPKRLASFEPTAPAEPATSTGAPT